MFLSPSGPGSTMLGAPSPAWSPSSSGGGGGGDEAQTNRLVQIFGLATGALSGACGGFMAVVLGIALWKTRRPLQLTPQLSAQRSVRTCHALLCAAGGCDFFYFLGVIMHQPFLPDSLLDNAVLCEIQGAMIDVFLLASACCLCALAHEIWYIHTNLLDTVQGGLPSPEEEWNARRKRSIAYAVVVVLVPTVAVTLNSLTVGYGTSGPPSNEAWCWLKHPESHVVNDFLGFFVWIWACGCISLGFSVATACKLRAASVMQIHVTDSYNTLARKRHARRKALGMTSYPLIFIAVWIPGSIRHFTENTPTWLEVMHFGAVGALGFFQLVAWIVLNRTVRLIMWEKVDDLLHCRCGDKRRSRSTLADMGRLSIAEERHLPGGGYSSMDFSELPSSFGFGRDGEEEDEDEFY